MEPEAERFKQLVENASRVLITSHISPDPDAISSVLLMGTALRLNFPQKQVSMVMEEAPYDDLSFLEGYDSIGFSSLSKSLQELKPELLIMLDANSYHRVTRDDPSIIQQYLTSTGAKVAVIDHHEPDEHNSFDLVINNKRPATAEEVYVLVFEQLGLRKPEGYAQTTLLGIMSDTQRIRFDHPGHRETYRVVSDLLDAGASIEKLEARLERYDKNQLETIAHLADNVVSKDGYTYSYIDDEFYRLWLERKKPLEDLKKGTDEFTNRYLRNFEGNSWGFLVYPDPSAGPNCWSVSLRSSIGSKDVSVIAQKLGGGGHKPAAGAKIKAGSVAEVLQRVQQAIAN